MTLLVAAAPGLRFGLASSPGLPDPGAASSATMQSVVPNDRARRE